MKTFRTAILAAATVALLGSLGAAEVTGNWKAEFETQIGQLKYIYRLKAEGDKVTGKALRERDGQKTEIDLKEGKVSADEISFVEMVKIQDQEVRIEYKGKIAGDEIKFTRKVGDFATTEMVAQREKEVPASVAGKWQAEFDTQIGKQKYIYEFKVDGDKLTGRAIGDIAGEKSDTEIAQGKLRGVEISFVENLKFQGQDVRVDYKGTLAGEEIKFTRKVADIVTEELVAKRVKEPASK